MNRLLGLLALCTFLLGCEKEAYPTYPKLSGQWKLIDASITLQGINSDSVIYVLNDTIITEEYAVSSISGNLVTFKQNYERAKPLDRFVINKTIWEFETNIIGLPSMINNAPGYTYQTYYSPIQDMYSGNYNALRTAEGRYIQITTYGLNELKLVYPNVWTMFRRNTNVEVFLKENVVLHFRRI
jgi:hypothetical protein